MRTISGRFFAFAVAVILVAAVHSTQARRLTWAQYKQNFKALRYPASGPGDSLPYRFLIPYNYNSSMKYPLVLALHGAGERGTDDTAQLKANYLATTWADSTSQALYPCFVVAPQCPITLQWVSASWAQPVIGQDTVPISIPLSMAIKLIDSLIRVYASIDTNRLFITGLSMGGWGTWDAITRFPGKFAVAIPICGGGDTSVVGPIATMPIWTAVGLQDPTIPPQASLNMVAAITRRGRTWLTTTTTLSWTNASMSWTQFVSQVKSSPTPQLIFNEFSNGQHDVWDTLLNDTLLIPWTFSKSKAITAVNRGMPAVAAGSPRTPGIGLVLHISGGNETAPCRTGAVIVSGWVLDLLGRNVAGAEGMKGKRAIGDGVYVWKQGK